MKKCISISLLIILSAPHLLRLGIMIQWKINQTYIAATFCENKGNTAMKCDGKCYLKKQLAKTEDQSPATPVSSGKAPVVKSIEHTPFLIRDTQFSFYNELPEAATNTGFPAVLLDYHFTFIPSFLDPPDSIV